MRGPGYVVSHLTAAAALGLPLPLRPLDTVHLTDLERRVARTRRHRGLWIHHADSCDTDGEMVDDLMATTAEDVTAQLAMQCHWPGRALRADFAVPLVDGRRESWLGSSAAVRFDEWRIDPPASQLIILDGRGTFVARGDAGWAAEGTVIELYGKATYSLPTDGAVDPAGASEAEKQRYDRVGDLGLERVRFGLHHLLHEGELVRRRVRERRAVGSAARFTGSFRELPDEGLRLA